MSLASGVNNPTIDNLVQSSLESEYKDLRLEWIPHEEITDVKPSQIDNVHYAIMRKDKTMIMLLLLGSDETCMSTLVSEFARIYSLPTHQYKSQYRRYSEWLVRRNRLINGFTKHDGNYYMVADKLFYHCYSRYGFCAACG